jgi:hypothetical protein
MMQDDAETRAILDFLLANDHDISARAVARLHSKIKAASSFTRSEARSALLADYKKRQHEYRLWRVRAGKQSVADTATALAKSTQRISELESNVQILVASHLALLRTVGELGGFKKWMQFFDAYKNIRNKIVDLGAAPGDIDSTEGKRIDRASSKHSA